MSKRTVATVASVCVVGLALGCDKQPPDDTAKAETEAHVGVGALSALALSEVVEGIESGAIENAAGIEALFHGKAELAQLDLDEDEQPEQLYVLERRSESATTFEIRAVEKQAEEGRPSSETLEDAPIVATVELVVEPEEEIVSVRAAYEPTLAAKAEIDVEEAKIIREFASLSVEADGTFRMEGKAEVFLAWTFARNRPVYRAELFWAAAEDPAPDPCWPPGHCKHGHWKATGDAPPSHGRDHDRDHDRDHERFGSKGKQRHKNDKHVGGKPNKRGKADKAKAKAKAKRGDKRKGKSGKAKGSGKSGKGKRK